MASSQRSKSAANVTSVSNPKLSLSGWARWGWRQLTSMRNAIILLLLLAVAAVPGSIFPQRTSDPNGVIQYIEQNPELAPIVEALGLFEVYSSVWFTAIYILLFISLIGCVLPRAKHYATELRQPPAPMPARLDRLTGYTSRSFAGAKNADMKKSAADLLTQAESMLRAGRYRVLVSAPVGSGAGKTKGAGDLGSIAAERGYLKELGNLVFHISLLGVLIAVAIGGMFGYTGQRVIVEGQTFVNTRSAYDTFNPGRLSPNPELTPFSLTLDSMDVVYETENPNAIGTATDYTAHVTVTEVDGSSQPGVVKVNEPLRTNGVDVYLMGNGYAPSVTVRDPEGNVVYRESVPFLPQDANLTSLGFMKVPDGLAEQVGMIGFFYPTQSTLSSGAFTSVHPELNYPVLTLTVYSGDLGIDEGTPQSVYTLDTDGMKLLAGRNADVPALELMPGQTVELPNGLGTVTLEDARGEAATESTYLESVVRFATFDIHSGPATGWVLLFTVIAIAGLLVSFTIARRRIWVKVVPGGFEVAGFAKSRDARLEDDVTKFADELEAAVRPARAAPAAKPTSPARPKQSRK